MKRGTVLLDITIPEDCVVILIQKIPSGRRIRVFKSLGEAGKKAEEHGDYALVVPKTATLNSNDLLAIVDAAPEEDKIEVGKILSRSAS